MYLEHLAFKSYHGTHDVIRVDSVLQAWGLDPEEAYPHCKAVGFLRDNFVVDNGERVVSPEMAEYASWANWIAYTELSESTLDHLADLEKKIDEFWASFNEFVLIKKSCVFSDKDLTGLEGLDRLHSNLVCKRRGDTYFRRDHFAAIVPAETFAQHCSTNAL
jgi:hypothetical protein